MKKSNFIICLLLSVFGTVLFTGCDQLQEDVFPESADQVSLSQFEKSLYIMPGGETIIDVTSKLRTFQNATLEIGEKPKNGSLQFVDGGLLQYAASDNFNKGTDFFTLKVMRNAQVLDQDTITIIIPSDTTEYPCWNGAMADRFFIDRDSLRGIYKMDVVSNDYLCDSTSFSLAVIQQPQHGSAKTANNLINYKPKLRDSLMVGDSFLYELCQMVEGNIHCTLAKVEIHFRDNPDSCLWKAVDDFYTLGNDSVNSETTFLAKVDVLANDQTCDSLKELSITKNADYGNAYIEDNYLYYSYPQQDIYTDSLRYQICNFEGICSEATLRFGVQ
jgi:hypothetical protein